MHMLCFAISAGNSYEECLGRFVEEGVFPSLLCVHSLLGIFRLSHQLLTWHHSV